MQQPLWVPQWALNSVFYHIYPLGFVNAPERNPGGDPVNRISQVNDWLDHIALLGAQAIYLGPVFESSSHGYDTVDYFRVDRRLGTEDAFRELVEHIHLRNMRVILDGVFNHTGRDFFAFRDVLEHREVSSYAGWYHITNWHGRSGYGDPFEYESWEGHQSLPKLNLSNPDVKGYLFEVARMWLGDVGVDGWRLDAATEIPVEFWWEFRRECKDIRPDCFLVGEMIHGDYNTWVAPDLLDSGTNYQLYNPIWRSINDENFFDLKSALERGFDAEAGLYRNLDLWTFLSNHDVSRIVSVLNNPRHVYLAFMLLMTVPGIPCLYYGDEVGLRGTRDDGDEALRAPMPPRDQWPDAEGQLYEAVTRLINIRRGSAALMYGSYHTLYVANNSFGFLRRAGDEAAIVLASVDKNSISMTVPMGQAGIPDGAEFVDVLNPGDTRFVVQHGQIEVPRLWPGWGRILIKQGN